MAKCKSTTLEGKSCQAQAIKGSDYCFAHDPSSGKARAKARKKGGQRRCVPHGGDPELIPKEVRTIEGVFKILDYELAEVIPLENSIQRGRLIVAIANAYLNVIKIDELESRIAAIETALQLKEVKE